MANRIGFQDGIEAFRQRGNQAIDPGKQWPDKLSSTLRTLKQGHNENIDRIKALEDTLDEIPFPFRGSSS